MCIIVSNFELNLIILYQSITDPKHMTCPREVYFLSTTGVIPNPGAGRSSEVERSLMVRWVVGSILHGMDPWSYFSFQPVPHDWCNKGRGMCYPVGWCI